MNTESRRFSAYLLLSFFGHLSFLLVLLFLTHRPTSAQNKPKVIYLPVDIVPSRKPTRVVRTNLVKPSKETTKDAFWGKQTQQVDRQTASSKGSGEGSSGKKVSLSKLGVGLTKPTPASNGGSASEFDDHITHGSETYLNTKESVYYSYFLRIRQSLDRAWMVGLRESLLKAYMNGRHLQGGVDYHTRVRVILNPQGEIARVGFVEEAGLDFVDKSCVEAFNKAGPFPNPPKGIVQDGQIVIEWEFILRT